MTSQAIDGIKKCGRCQQRLSVEEFPRNKSRKDGLHTYCRTCASAVQQEWRAKNPTYMATYNRKLLYGLNSEQFENMLEGQQGLCALCDTKMKLPQVDHDHETGKVRALLCVGCNTGLGKFGDDPNRLRRAAAYLEQHDTKGK